MVKKGKEKNKIYEKKKQITNPGTKTAKRAGLENNYTRRARRYGVIDHTSQEIELLQSLCDTHLNFEGTNLYFSEQRLYGCELFRKAVSL